MILARLAVAGARVVPFSRLMKTRVCGERAL